MDLQKEKKARKEKKSGERRGRGALDKEDEMHGVLMTKAMLKDRQNVSNIELNVKVFQY